MVKVSSVGIAELKIWMKSYTLANSGALWNSSPSMRILCFVPFPLFPEEA
jgi:hypothetical protein